MAVKERSANLFVRFSPVRNLCGYLTLPFTSLCTSVTELTAISFFSRSKQRIELGWSESEGEKRYGSWSFRGERERFANLELLTPQLRSLMWWWWWHAAGDVVDDDESVQNRIYFYDMSLFCSSFCVLLRSCSQYMGIGLCACATFIILLFHSKFYSSTLAVGLWKFRESSSRGGGP